MKARVHTIHGKIIVAGGENPENMLKPHEILLEEKPDGTVDLKERTINGKVVSITGSKDSDSGDSGDSTSSNLKIKYYYSKSTGYQLAENHYEGIISTEDMMPVNANSCPIDLGAWYGYILGGSYNLCLGYYTEETNGKTEENIVSSSLPYSEDKSLEEIAASYLKSIEYPLSPDFTFAIYRPDENNVAVTTDLSLLCGLFKDTTVVDRESIALYSYDSETQEVKRICSWWEVFGILQEMEYNTDHNTNG